MGHFFYVLLLREVAPPNRRAPGLGPGGRRFSRHRRDVFPTKVTHSNMGHFFYVLLCLNEYEFWEVAPPYGRRETGIKIIQETHRFRWSYAAHVVREYLEQFPNLQLALDISHWFCVSESFLEDQQDAVNLALQHSVHLHARIGHTQGPQVTDPRIPDNDNALQHHLKYWDKWIEHLRRKGIDECTITPEFGPKPYMIYTPHDNKPVTELWEINCWMKDLLYLRYRH